jgi:hypothetical protein
VHIRRLFTPASAAASDKSLTPWKSTHLGVSWFQQGSRQPALAPAAQTTASIPWHAGHKVSGFVISPWIKVTLDTPYAVSHHHAHRNPTPATRESVKRTLYQTNMTSWHCLRHSFGTLYKQWCVLQRSKSQHRISLPRALAARSWLRTSANTWNLSPSVSNVLVT